MLKLLENYKIFLYFVIILKDLNTEYENTFYDITINNCYEKLTLITINNY